MHQLLRRCLGIKLIFEEVGSISYLMSLYGRTSLFKTKEKNQLANGFSLKTKQNKTKNKKTKQKTKQKQKTKNKTKQNKKKKTCKNRIYDNLSYKIISFLNNISFGSEIQMADIHFDLANKVFLGKDKSRIY